jgi:hypothetical protein
MFLWPITVAARSKAWTVFARLNAGIMSSNPTQSMDVCVRLFCVYVVLCVRSGLAIPRPRSPTDCEYDYETEKSTKVQRAVEP